jgi:hypothetical protein
LGFDARAALDALSKRLDTRPSGDAGRPPHRFAKPAPRWGPATQQFHRRLSEALAKTDPPITDADP